MIPLSYLLIIWDYCIFAGEDIDLKESDEEQCHSRLVDVLTIWTENAWNKANEI